MSLLLLVRRKNEPCAQQHNRDEMWNGQREKEGDEKRKKEEREREKEARGEMRDREKGRSRVPSGVHQLRRYTLVSVLMEKSAEK